MRHRIPLPRRLGESFHVRDAATLGVSRARTDAKDLHRPFHGVRSLTAASTFEEHVEVYRPRLRDGQRLAGLTAARLWGLPVPPRWSPAEPIDIAVATEKAPPETVGVRGRRLALARSDTWKVRGLPVVDADAACFTTAPLLSLDDAVIMLDALVTTAHNYPGRAPRRPLSTLERVEARLELWGRFPGSRTIRGALPLVRERVESPKETQTRLAIMAAGLPEPVVQYEVRLGGILIARTDLAYPRLRIAIEYEGDGHRTDRAQWRTDIRRQRELEDLGWIVIRMTEHDLREGLASFLTRVRRAIAARNARS